MKFKQSVNGIVMLCCLTYFSYAFDVRRDGDGKLDIRIDEEISCSRLSTWDINQEQEDGQVEKISDGMGYSAIGFSWDSSGYFNATIYSPTEGMKNLTKVVSASSSDDITYWVAESVSGDKREFISIEKITSGTNGLGLETGTAGTLTNVSKVDQGPCKKINFKDIAGVKSRLGGTWKSFTEDYDGFNIKVHGNGNYVIFEYAEEILEIHTPFIYGATVAQSLGVASSEAHWLIEQCEARESGEIRLPQNPLFLKYYRGIDSPYLALTNKRLMMMLGGPRNNLTY